jgi:hypothetical protein
MKTTFSMVAVVAVSMAVGATAAARGQERIPELPRQGASDVKSITLTGCVERGPTTDSFTLREAKEGAATPSDATPRLPVALSSTDVNFSKHVGHSVSVTGSYAVAEIATGTAGTEKPAPAAPAAITEGDGKTARTFTVKSLKMLADSCQQPTN